MRNDSLDDLSLKPTRDELAQRQQVRGGQSASRSPSTPVKGHAVAVNTAPLWSLIVLLMVAMAGGGWYLWDQVRYLQQNLNQSLSALNQSEQALSGLQQSLDNRDKTLNKSGDQMAAEIKELSSEVRKLWDVANKRNKASLDEHQAAITALQAGLKTQTASTEKLGQSNADAINGLRQDLQKARDSFAALQTALDQQKTAFDKQNAELAKLKSQLASPNDLDDRLTVVEVSLKSIDAYRKQVNVRLDQLDQQLGQLYRKEAAP